MTVKNEKKKNKGDYGYLLKNKVFQLTVSLILMVMVLVIFYTGYIRYGNTKNIFTVFAIVSVIPAAKFMVAYIVMAPYKEIKAEIYEEMKDFSNAFILYDLLISSTERIIHTDIAAVRDNSVFLYVADKKYDKAYVEKYIRSFLEKECKVTSVKMIRDYKEFKKAVQMLDKNEAGKYDTRIKELMMIYSM